jgi:hypothetical protein
MFADLASAIEMQMLYCNTDSTFSPLSGDQLAIGKETARRLGMGTNMYPSSALLEQNKDESIASLPIDELIETADGFAGVFPGRTLQNTCFF